MPFGVSLWHDKWLPCTERIPLNIHIKYCKIVGLVTLVTLLIANCFYPVCYFSSNVGIFLLKIFILLNSSLQALGRTFAGWQSSNIYVNLIIVNLINDYDYNTV